MHESDTQPVLDKHLLDINFSSNEAPESMRSKLRIALLRARIDLIEKSPSLNTILSLAKLFKLSSIRLEIISNTIIIISFSISNTQSVRNHNENELNFANKCLNISPEHTNIILHENIVSLISSGKLSTTVFSKLGSVHALEVFHHAPMIEYIQQSFIAPEEILSLSADKQQNLKSEKLLELHLTGPLTYADVLSLTPTQRRNCECDLIYKELLAGDRKKVAVLKIEGDLESLRLFPRIFAHFNPNNSEKPNEIKLADLLKLTAEQSEKILANREMNNDILWTYIYQERITLQKACSLTAGEIAFLCNPYLQAFINANNAALNLTPSGVIDKLLFYFKNHIKLVNYMLSGKASPAEIFCLNAFATTIVDNAEISDLLTSSKINFSGIVAFILIYEKNDRLQDYIEKGLVNFEQLIFSTQAQLRFISSPHVHSYLISLPASMNKGYFESTLEIGKDPNNAEDDYKILRTLDNLKKSNTSADDIKPIPQPNLPDNCCCRLV